MASFREAFRSARLAIRNRIVTGLAILVPLAVTVWVVYFLFRTLDGLLQPLLIQLIGSRIPGAGVLATGLLLYLVGLLVQNIGFRSLLHWTERVLLKLPILKDVYGSSKAIVETFTSPTGKSFKRVVAFEYPRKGTRAFGFVTNEVTLADGSEEVAVFLPTTPNPTSGFLLFLPAESVIETSLTVDEALKMIVSGGVVIPRPYEELMPNGESLATDDDYRSSGSF